MATYDLDRTELNDLLKPNIDPMVRTAVLDYLFSDHGHQHLGHYGLDTSGHDGSTDKIEVQISDGTDPLDPKADALVLTGTDNSVTTDANLKAIIENVATDTTLTVDGTHSVFVAMGNGNDLVRLEDSGNDTVYGGAGQDSIYGGAGNDLLVAGAGSHQLLEGGDGNDTLWGGAGGYDSLYGGAGNDVIHAGAGAHQFVDSGTGNDTIWAGSGNDTLVGGGGNDVFHIDPNSGNDTIDGGSGHSIIDFDHFSSTDVKSIGESGGVTVITFTDGQTITATNIQEFVFTDHEHKAS
jgi:Ca2+-binding RTX toxin-like protein